MNVNKKIIIVAVIVFGVVGLNALSRFNHTKQTVDQVATSIAEYERACRKACEDNQDSLECARCKLVLHELQNAALWAMAAQHVAMRMNIQKIESEAAAREEIRYLKNRLGALLEKYPQQEDLTEEDGTEYGEENDMPATEPQKDEIVLIETVESEPELIER